MQEERQLFGSVIFLVIAVAALWMWINMLQETNSSFSTLEPVAQQEPVGTPIGGDTPTFTPIPPTETPDPPTQTPTAIPPTETVAPPTNTPIVTVQGNPTETPSAPTVTATSTLPPPPTEPTETPVSVPPEDSCLRFNFDIGGDEAREGTFIAQEVGGRILATWQAQDGWQDSGWIEGIKLSHKSVYVDVYYVSPDGSERIRMKMLNPAPGTDHGWLTEGLCHALEIEWP